MVIFPLRRVTICDGHQLEVTCTITNGSLLRWNITHSQDDRGTTAQSFTRTFSSSGQSSKQTPINTSSTVITFMRRSAEGRTPLISTILITKIQNGTTIECVEKLTSESAVVMIHVMDLNFQSKIINTLKIVSIL